MAADHRSNGEDPFPPPVRNPILQRQRLRETLERIDEDVFEGPVGKRLASNIGALVTRADQHSSDMEAFSRTVFDGFARGDDILRGLHGTLQELVTKSSLPPMRAETPSVTDELIHTRKSFSEHLRELAKNTPGGANVVQAPTIELEEAASKFFEERMAAYLQRKHLRELEEAEIKAKADALKKIEDDKREAAAALERRRTFWALTVSATIAVLVGVAGTYFVTKATEHEKGFAEGVKAAPTNTVVLTSADVPSVSASVAVPVPAAAAPAKRGK